MKQIEVSKLEQFISWVKDINAEFGNHKHLFFRGHSKTEYKLIPSVFRKNDKVEYNEREVLLDFERYSPVHKINYSFIDEIDKVLVDIRHYGLPTRLLDWTLAPLNALFFACSENENNDAHVIAFNVWEYWKKIVREENHQHKEIHKIHIIARSLLAKKWNFETIKEHIEKKFSYSYLQPEDIEHPFPFIANYTNDRVLHQRGCFTIHGKCHAPIDSIQNIDSFLRRVLIKAEFKKAILYELHLMYINHYSIYPDFEGMSKVIRRYGSLFTIKNPNT